MRTFVLAVTILAATAAYADDGALKSQIETIVSKYQEGVNGKNLDGILALYANESIFLAADGRALHGKDEIGKMISGYLTQGPHEVITVSETHRDGDSAIAIGTFSDTLGANMKIAGTWNAVYDMSGGQPHIRLLAVSISPPAPK